MVNKVVILSNSEGSAVFLTCAKGKSWSFVSQDDTFVLNSILFWEVRNVQKMAHNLTMVNMRSMLLLKMKKLVAQVPAAD
jgi:hypothetical protein